MSAVRPIRVSALALAMLGLVVPAVPSWAASSAVASGMTGSAPFQLAQAQDDGDPGAGDTAELVVRIGRLEQQIRQMTGQIEQLQFDNRKLEDNMRKMQGDIDFRLQDLEHPGGAGAPRAATPQRRGDADIAPAPAVASGASSAPTSSSPAPAPVAPVETARAAAGRRTGGDAFNPDSDPGAPGAPRPLGTTTPSAPIEARSGRQAGTGAPLDLMRPGTAGAEASAASTPSVIDAPAAAPRDPNSVASLAPGGTRDEFDQDVGLYKQGQYDGAATGFKAFADKYPKDRLVPDAVFLAGESYARLGRQREAAEQFLKVSTDFAKSARAPDALLRLGMALGALGAKEQACATYAEVGRRYPAASAEVKAGVDRETKRARCPANG